MPNKLIAETYPRAIAPLEALYPEAGTSTCGANSLGIDAKFTVAGLEPYMYIDTIFPHLFALYVVRVTPVAGVNVISSSEY